MKSRSRRYAGPEGGALAEELIEAERASRKTAAGAGYNQELDEKQRPIHPDYMSLDFPGVEDGIRGMQFIDTVVKAGYDDTAKWVKFGE